MNSVRRATSGLGAAAHAVARVSGYLWAGPNTLIGLMLAMLALRGGRLTLAGGVLEAAGGGVRGFLRRFPVRGNVLALTLGHVVLASDEAAMAEFRNHELVHVRQYARWGPLFLPAYAAASLIALARRRDPYLENAFERDAFRRDLVTTAAAHRYHGSEHGTSRRKPGDALPF